MKCLVTQLYEIRFLFNFGCDMAFYKSTVVFCGKIIVINHTKLKIGLFENDHK